MKKLLKPTLVESEPFEVAMGGYLVTVCSLVDGTTKRTLAPQLKFKNFIETSPNGDFSVLVAWLSTRDESDLKLVILDNESGEITELCPIHSLPVSIKWRDEKSIEFSTRVRPSISRLPPMSEFDLAKPTIVTVTKGSDDFGVAFKTEN